MTNLVILSDKERKQFDSPAMFNYAERSIYFSLDQKIIDILKSMRTPTNKVGFMLQFGHFKSHRKFYINSQFNKQNINHIVQSLNLDSSKVDIEQYSKNIRLEHRIKILAYLKWQSLNKVNLDKIYQYILYQTKNQSSPREIFDLAIDYCWNNKIELPSSYQLTLLITNAYNEFESLVMDKIKAGITNKTKKDLENLLEPSEQDQYQRAPITNLKQVNQSLRPMQIKGNVDVFSNIQGYFNDIENILDDLSLSDQAIDYYATWIQKAQLTQIKSLSDRDDPNKLYLYLMAFLKHQYT